MKNADRSPKLPVAKRATGASDDAYHHGDLRGALLRAVGEILDESGPAALTLRECARRAGVSHAAPAHHFGDLRGLLTEYVADQFETLALYQAQSRARAPADPAAQFLAAGEGYVRFALSHPAQFRLMFRSDQLAAVHPRCTAAGEAAFAHLPETLALMGNDPAKAEHRFEQKIALAWALVHGFAVLTLDNAWFAGGAQPDIEASVAKAREQLEMTGPAFAPPSAPPRRKGKAQSSGTAAR